MNCELCSNPEALKFNKALSTHPNEFPREGKFQVCPGDGRLHHHGAVHTLHAGLAWVCDSCYGLVEKQWSEAKEKAQAKAQA